MIIIPLANGFEEVEALTPLDLLRRGGLTVKTVSIGNEKTAVGSHGIEVNCDLCADEVELDTVTDLILPGGMPGTLHLDESSLIDRLITHVNGRGGRIAAICAAPLILGRRGLLDGKQAICYPGFEEELKGASIINKPVVTDGNITTAKGMGAAFAFGYELLCLFAGEEKAKGIAAAAMYPYLH